MSRSAAEALERRRRARIAGVLTTVGVAAGLTLFGVTEGGPRRPGPPPSPPPPTTECEQRTPPPASPGRYDGPERVLEDGIDYAAVVHTSCGEITIDLLEDTARTTVNNFVFLAREGFYDGLIWHRVERNSVLQTGDPNGLWGALPEGPGYTIPDELPDEPKDYHYGTVGMANEGLPDTGGSQWFIVVHEDEPPAYDPNYSIFGEVEPDSYPTLELIERQRTRGGAARSVAEAVKPLIPIYIYSIDILER